MLPVQTKAYKIFDWFITAADALIVAVYLGLSTTRVVGPEHFGASVYTTAIGLTHIVYRLGLYPYLKNRSQIGASLIGSFFFAANLAILLVTTGGFASPYYALWLLLIIAVGIYRPSVPLGLLAITTLYFAGETFIFDVNSALLTNTVISLLVTYISGALGFWLWHSHHTQLREAESYGQLSQQLTAEQLKSELVLHHIGDGVIVVDASSKVQLLNPAAEKLTGWSEIEAKDIDYKIVLPLSSEHQPTLSSDTNPFGQAIAKSQAILRDDIMLTSRSGKKVALSLMVSPIFNDQSQISGLIGVFRDISAAKEAERLRNEFISTASHEMRTPVAAVEGYIALALNQKVAQIDDKARMYLLRAQESTQHLGKLFQDLLATTRIEEGKLPNHPEPVELGNLIGQVIDELHLKAEKKSLRLGLKATQTGGPTRNLRPIYYSLVDPERIREVLANLIDNAIKFTSKGEVSVTLDGNDKEVEIGVHDSGSGIAPEDTPHLFQKFYRPQISQTRDSGGTGLGLYISRAIVEMYQGRIWVDSKPDGGSHFYFVLPRLSFEKADALLTEMAKNSPAPAKATPSPAPDLIAAGSADRVE